MRPFFYFLIIITLFLFFPNKPIKIKKSDYIKVSNTKDEKIFYGIIKASNSADLSFQSEGKIVFLPYTKGDYVRKNQIIARLDGTLYKIKKNEEDAKLKEIFIQKQKQEKYYKRLNILHAQGAISDNDWESAFYELKSLNKQIEIQKEKIKYLDKEISYNIISAPFDGFISQKYIDLNSYAKIGQPIVNIISKGSIQAETMVDENFINKLKLNQNIQAKINNQIYKGKITHISKSSLNSGGFLIKIEIINPTSNLKEGMSAEIDFSSEKKFLTLPIQCIKKEEETYVLKIIKEENGYGKISKNKVTTGQVYKNEIEIIDGVKEDELILCTNNKKYYENLRVKL